MRTSAITAFAKNIPSLSRRSALTTGAAALLLSIGLPLLPGAFSASACGAPDNAPVTAATAAPAPTVPHQGTVGVGFYMLGKEPLTITAGGPKLELPMEVGNFTGAPYEKVVPHLSLYNEKAGSHPGGGTNLRLQDLSVEVNTGAGWKKVPLVHGCDPVIYADTGSLRGEHLADGHAVHFTFRVGLSANAPKDQTEIQIGVSASTEDRSEAAVVPQRDFRTVQVRHPAAAKPTTAPAPKPTSAPAEPAAAVTTPTATATPSPTATAATATATAAVPATEPTALAETGTSSPNGFLAGSAAAFVALGAGVMIAVRRLRNQG